MNKLIYILILLLYNGKSFAQSVTISPNNNSKIIDTTGTNKAVLMPSVSATSAITLPQKGMVVFDDASGTLSYYNGVSWIPMPNSTSIGWAVNGNNIYSNNSGKVGIGTLTPITKLSLYGDLAFTNMVSPTNGVGTYHNVDVTNSSWIYLNSSGQIVTGFSGGTHGKILFVTCPSSFILKTLDLGSLFANRIIGNSNISQTLTIGGCILIYNTNIARWMIVASW